LEHFLCHDLCGGLGLIFFSPSFDMCKEDRKGVNFSVRFLFHYWMAREGGQGFFLFFWYVERGWEGEGEGLIF
jgi:hypothetical protein